MTLQQNIEAKIRSSLAPAYLEVVNESHMHSVPPGSESHFRVVVVSERFENMALVKRHQTINQILERELRESLHALSMQTLTTAEWAQRNGETLPSPACLGGGKSSG